MSTPSNWAPTRVAKAGGYHRIMATGPAGPVDITFLRDAASDLASYSSADPFSDATASINFPMLGPLDDPNSPELRWLREDTLIDIWWIPAMAVPANWDPTPDGDRALWLNPITNQQDLICPAYDYQWDGTTWNRLSTKRGSKVWEGFIAGISVSQDESSASLGTDCQGALFQADLIYAKPFYPPRPQTNESLILGVFDRGRQPSLRTHQARVEWPDGWALTAPNFSGTTNDFTPNVRPGAKWTGYTTRQTGAWDKALTSFIQNMLAVMLTKPDSGVAAGMQWTLRNMLEGDPNYPAGRTPVLMVRDRNVPESFALSAGAPGITLNLSADSTQKTNIAYGSGTDVAGTTWRGAVVSADGSRTDYLPLAYERTVYPAHDNKALNPREFARESFTTFDNGMGQLDGQTASQQMIKRDRDAGWTGTIVLKVDPSPTLSMWQIRAGSTVRLKNFMGSGETGIRFHIAQVEASVSGGTVTLTVDTRYRDALTLVQAIARTRDALTPSKLLRLNANSVTIEDIQAPWDYTAGSGFIPRPARVMYRHKPADVLFPYASWVRGHPPRSASFRRWYVECNGKAKDTQKRWAKAAVLMSEKGTIRRTEIFMVDLDGNLVPHRFHVSFYYFNGIDGSFMPNDGKSWSPFLTGAFDAVDPSTGQPWKIPNRVAPNSFIVGWGNYAQPAGYSPGVASQRLLAPGYDPSATLRGTAPTGMLIDDGSWSFDCSTNNKEYVQLAPAGGEKPFAITIYAMFYTDYPGKVYFGGRLYREEPGSTS